MADQKTKNMEFVEAHKTYMKAIAKIEKTTTAYHNATITEQEAVRCVTEITETLYKTISIANDPAKAGKGAIKAVMVSLLRLSIAHLAYEEAEAATKGATADADKATVKMGMAAAELAQAAQEVDMWGYAVALHGRAANAFTRAQEATKSACELRAGEQQRVEQKRSTAVNYMLIDYVRRHNLLGELLNIVKPPQ